MSWVLAIDFGTTTTSAAMGVEGRAEVVEIDGAARMPSVVMATDSGDLVVGSAAEAQLALAPERAERTPKRRLGDEVMLLGSRPVRPVEAVAAILGTIAAEAIRRQGGEPPSELRLTHPARWGSLRRQKLAEAAALAGLPEPVFVPEPVAAAVHFLDSNIEEGAFVAVYDLGGGTFDTAVLRRSGDGFDVVGLPGGDERLGGEAFDERLFAHVGARIAEDDPDAWESLRFSTERSWRKVGHDLRMEVRRAKEALSTNAEYTIYVGSPVDTTVLLTRDELERIIRADVDATVDELEATVERAGIERAELAAVNLAGGSSRIPLVTRLVAERFGMVPQTWGDPKAAVALGAVRATRLTSVATGGQPVIAPAVVLPEQVGGHEVLGELGRGGMGVVYLASQSSVGRLVAVKTLPILDPGLTDRLRREAAVLAELQHPNIATVIDVASDDRGTHVVMPYFPGGTVAHVLDQEGALPPAQAVSVVTSVAAALAATHDKGFLHRDVKPSNVLLSEGGDVYLADFGLALPMLDSSRLTNSRSVLGTAPYTAPEILSDEPASPAADTYALGVTAYQLLTGHLPYSGSNVMAVLDAVRRGTPTPIQELAPAVPEALAALVTQAFAADPAERPADLRAWATQVRAAVEPEQVRPAPPVGWAKAAAAASGAAGAVLASGSAAAGGPSGDPVEVAAGAPSVPPDVKDLVGFQPKGRDASGPGSDDTDLAPVPDSLRRSGRSSRLVLSGAVAVVILLVAAFVVFAGDDAATVTGTDSTDTTLAEGTDGEETDGEVEVPDLIGESVADATSALEEAGLVVQERLEDSTEPPGTVLRQDPAGGEAAEEGTSVLLIVAQKPTDTTETTTESTGTTATTATTATTVDRGGDSDDDDGGDPPPPTTYAVPNVVRVAEATARSRIQQANLTVGAVSQAYSSSVPAGQVISTSPAAGTRLAARSTVAMIVSRGPTPPARPTVNISGPSGLYACWRYGYTVALTGATSGTWRTSFGFTSTNMSSAFIWLEDFSSGTRAGWIEFVATGPGGTASDRINITGYPDGRVTHTRSRAECESVAYANPIQ